MMVFSLYFQTRNEGKDRGLHSQNGPEIRNKDLIGNPHLQFDKSSQKLSEKNTLLTRLLCLGLKVSKNDFKIVADKQEWNKESKLPAEYIRREDMKINDVAMKYVLPFLPGKSLMKFQAMSNE
ncbi:hypothetical protein KY285_007876 [Solanum tuberosum]|nr:hypothetical protein KY285_007876 [Solanum tuberosum]